MNVDSSEDKPMAAKRAKARRYSAEPWRIAISAMSVVLRSDHGERCVSIVDDAWSCDCEFFSTRNICSHTIALREILTEQTGIAMPAL
jgi:hypothetical protein